MSGTRIVACTCIHEFQDTRYGKGRRAANVDKSGVAHCTACGAEQGKKASAVEAAKRTGK